MASMPLTIQITLTDEQLEVITEALAVKMGKASPNPLTVSQFAAAVDRSVPTITRWLKAGVITKSPTPGQTMIPYSELERYRSGKPS